MRTSRSILYTAVSTVLCLLYVFQQTEIVKLGYRITSAQKVLEACQDRKTSLEYAASSLESPLNLDKNLFLKNDGFQMPEAYKLVKVGVPQGATGAVAQPKLARQTVGSMFKRLASAALFRGEQAEAKTIK